MKQSTLLPPQVQRKSIVDNLAQALREIAQAASESVAKPQRILLVTLGTIIVFTNLTFSEPRKAADLVGRGLSAPLWSQDDRFMAYTTADLNELYVVELNEVKAKQSLYRVSNLDGVGRRFAFQPGEDRIAFRTMVGAITSHPERIFSSSIYSHDPKMLTSNTGPIHGPYRIENKLFYRSSLDQPLISVDGQPWSKIVNLLDGSLSISDSTQTVRYVSPTEEKVEGFEISPDGQWVAAVVKTSTERQVQLIQISTGAVTNLGKGRWPGWSGDGNRVVVIRDKPEVRFAELLVYDIKLGQTRSVVGLTNFWPDEPALNSNGTKVAFIHEGEIYLTEVTGF